MYRFIEMPFNYNVNIGKLLYKNQSLFITIPFYPSHNNKTQLI